MKINANTGIIKRTRWEYAWRNQVWFNWFNDLAILPYNVRHIEVANRVTSYHMNISEQDKCMLGGNKGSRWPRYISWETSLWPVVILLTHENWNNVHTDLNEKATSRHCRTGKFQTPPKPRKELLESTRKKISATKPEWEKEGGKKGPVHRKKPHKCVPCLTVQITWQVIAT